MSRRETPNTKQRHSISERRARIPDCCLANVGRLHSRHGHLQRRNLASLRSRTGGLTNLRLPYADDFGVEFNTAVSRRDVSEWQREKSVRLQLLRIWFTCLVYAYHVPSGLLLRYCHMFLSHSATMSSYAMP